MRQNPRKIPANAKKPAKRKPQPRPHPRPAPKPPRRPRHPKSCPHSARQSASARATRRQRPGRIRLTNPANQTSNLQSHQSRLNSLSMAPRMTPICATPASHLRRSALSARAKPSSTSGARTHHRPNDLKPALLRPAPKPRACRAIAAAATTPAAPATAPRARTAPKAVRT